MQSGIGKKTPYLLLTFFLPILMGILDWNHFFPLSAQPDLMFQITGELLALATLVGATVLMSFGIGKVREGGKKLGTGILLRLLVAGSFSAFLLTLGWRDFFLDHQFSLSATRPRHLASVLVASLFFSIVGFSLEEILGKRSGQRDKSVVRVNTPLE